MSRKIVREEKNKAEVIGWFFVFITLLVYVSGNIFSKLVADKFVGPSFDRFLYSLFILVYALLLTRGVTWFVALRFIPLSRAYPILSLTFPLILIISVFMFNEHLTIGKVLGSAAIVAGVIITGKKS
jgi:drug/metabolite transporter (DMT)-like permease